VFGKVAIAGLVLFALLQVVRPSIPVKPTTAEVQAPPQIRQILEKNCYICHSYKPRLAWFGQIVPGYWLVRHDILTASGHMDFSTLGARPSAAWKATLCRPACSSTLRQFLTRSFSWFDLRCLQGLVQIARGEGPSKVSRSVFDKS
jgi:Haem-binding domain